MKARTLFEFIGLRSPPRTYGHRIDTFELERQGQVRFAQWLHPKCRAKTVSQATVDELSRYIAPGDAVLDIGAHIGDTAVPFALAAGPTGRVFAVEPNRYVLPILELNARLNPMAAPITVLPYAATKETAELTFDYSDPGFCNGGDLSGLGRLRGGHLYRLDVEGRNIVRELEDLAPEWLARVKFVKTDTEGNDLAVVETLRKLIDGARPYLLCEVYRHASTDYRRSFHRLLSAELNYRLHRAQPYTELRGKELGADDMMRESHFDVFCVPAERS
ncbi:MAG: FkbM family methyltransferase [Mesorhizobium sp.]